MRPVFASLLLLSFAAGCAAEPSTHPRASQPEVRLPPQPGIHAGKHAVAEPRAQTDPGRERALRCARAVAGFGRAAGLAAFL